MVTLEQIASAALARDGLQLRSLVQDYLRENADFSHVQPPATDQGDILITAAALLELLAARRNQSPPAWTRAVGPLAQPVYMVAAADNLPRLRRLCETDSPEPLRRRRLYAPPNFLTFV